MNFGPDGKFSAYNQKNNFLKNPKGADLNMEEKDFFEKLAKVNVNEEFEPQLAKSGLKEKEEEIEIFEGPEGQLAVDVYQTPTNFIIESPVAGIKAEDLDISINPDAIIIKGKRQKAEQIEEKDYFHKECFWGRFSRSIILPEEIDPDKSHASLKNGVLKIVLPKLNRRRTKKIKVKFD